MAVWMGLLSNAGPVFVSRTRLSGGGRSLNMRSLTNSLKSSAVVVVVVVEWLSTGFDEVVGKSFVFVAA